MKTAEEFWDWFRMNHHPYLFVNEVENAERERLFDLFIEQLHAYCEGLYFEMGGNPKEDQELIISAEGIEKRFHKVEELVDKAPVIPGWKVIAFKQPKGEGFKTEYNGIVFDPENIYFMPLENSKEPQLIGIKVFVAGFEEETKNDFIAGTYLMLDGLIGEKSVTLDIDYLDIKGMPENEEGIVGIKQLAAYIMWKKSQHS
ncbi:MAG: hypothetical protein JWO44_1953 [Bacteroidetes bacterium]|nr:hypothetical protein [Bacteroidota bacterium]